MQDPFSTPCSISIGVWIFRIIQQKCRVLILIPGSSGTKRKKSLERRKIYFSTTISQSWFAAVFDNELNIFSQLPEFDKNLLSLQLSIYSYLNIRKASWTKINDKIFRF